MFSVAARDSCSTIRSSLAVKTTSLAAAVCSQGNRPIGQAFHASQSRREKKLFLFVPSNVSVG